MAICVDFDGVLNTYTKYEGDDVLCDPAPGVEDFLKGLQSFGHPIVVHTARKPAKVIGWLREHGLAKYIHTVTDKKVPAIVYIDDRGLKFEGDFKETLRQLAEFKVWYKDVCPFEDWTNDESIYGSLEEREII